MYAKTASPLRLPPGHGRAVPGRSNTDVRVNGEPERWLVAARLSRVAKKDRERGDDVINGIQTQDRRSTEWAQQEGHTIIHVTRDRNVSGAIAPWDRAELGPWLTDPEKIVQYDGIVAYDVARVSREYFDLAWLRKWCELNHKKLYVIKERLRWPDNRDGALWGVAAERAYEERQDIIERVTRELGALREAGKLTGRYPFGYVSAGEKYDRYLTPTGDGRKYVPLIYRHCTTGCRDCAECCRHHVEGCPECAKGWSVYTIAQWLNSEGVRPPQDEKSLSEIIQWLDDEGIELPPDRKSLSEVTQWLDNEGIKLPERGWWAKTIAAMIKNPVYKGHLCERETVPPDEAEERDGAVVRYRYGDSWVANPRWQYGKTIHRCEGLVDAAVWKRANEALSTRAKRGHYDRENRAMLAEALSCPFCEDSPMYRIKTPGRKHPYLYYRCYGRGTKRSSCGNMVRLELVDAAVNEIMTSTFNKQVKRHKIVYGNEAEIQAELERINFERKQLAARALPWDEEDRERARLREEFERVSSTTLIDDHVELIDTDDTYSGLWERLDTAERGAWLAEHGFRVTASKELVTVTQGATRGTADLSEPEREAPVRKYWGKCECGCGSDLYSNGHVPKRFLNETHRMRAVRRMKPSKPEEPPLTGQSQPSPGDLRGIRPACRCYGVFLDCPACRVDRTGQYALLVFHDRC
jgi:DNA invertase Pin-like site-specific DNA recombinase